MTDATSAQAIEEKVNLITATLKALQSGGDEGYLREVQALLRKSLGSLLLMFDRNPGLDAATVDLYAAAAALVTDMAASSQPPVRKRRLLKEAQDRFEERIATSRPSGRKTSADWRQNEIFLAA